MNKAQQKQNQSENSLQRLNIARNKTHNYLLK